jgi:hypothetical protein
MTTKLKDSNAVVDYLCDFADEMVRTTDTLATIVGGTLTVTPSGLTVGTGSPPAPAIVSGTDKTGATVVSAAVRYWLTGGTVGVEYEVLCRVTTTGSRTLDHTMTIRVVNT